MQARIIFITGTDTGVGKTLLTGLLLAYLRTRGHHALALKPFCSGSRTDVKFLSSIQDHELEYDMINPYHFAQPLAPMVAARKCGRRIPLHEATRHIWQVAEPSDVSNSGQKQKRVCDFILVEGAGGLLSPLGEGYSALDVVRRLGCEVIVTAGNRLGVINHTALTVCALQVAGIEDITVVLMNHREDVSSRSNARVLSEIVDPIRVFSIPFLGRGASKPARARRAAKNLKKVLARIVR